MGAHRHSNEMSSKRRRPAHLAFTRASDQHGRARLYPLHVLTAPHGTEIVEQRAGTRTEWRKGVHVVLNEHAVLPREQRVLAHREPAHVVVPKHRARVARTHIACAHIAHNLIVGDDVDGIFRGSPGELDVEAHAAAVFVVQREDLQVVGVCKLGRGTAGMCPTGKLALCLGAL